MGSCLGGLATGSFKVGRDENKKEKVKAVTSLQRRYWGSSFQTLLGHLEDAAPEASGSLPHLVPGK